MTSALHAGDNLPFLDSLLASGQAGSIDLVYLDPPFSTGDRFGMAGQHGVQAAYDDAWTSLAAYLEFLQARLVRLHRLLADHGALFLHCDWRTSAHLRLMLESIFGAQNFRNEIIWRRGDNRGRKSCAGHLGRTVDSILYFVKNADHPALRFQTPVHARRHRLGTGGRPPAGFHRDADGRYFKTAPRGDYTDASIARLRAENRIYETRNGRLRVKYFLDTDGDCLLEPMPLDTLWTDLPDAMHLPARERFGYPTQKPLALLKRIVACASNPGDRICDPFCGSGTTLVAAAELGRRFLGCDRSPCAVNLAAARLVLAGAGEFTRSGEDPVHGEIAALPAVLPLAAEVPRRSARGVRLRKNASSPAAGVNAFADGGTEPALIVERHRAGVAISRRPILAPSIDDAQLSEKKALATKGGGGYDVFLIDGLGRRLRWTGPAALWDENR